MNEILLQGMYYGIVMLLSMGAVAVYYRGFFFPYFKVRSSFGKYVMIKARSQLRDFFIVGWVEDGFLCFKLDKEKVRLCLNPKAKQIYKCLSVNWVDYDVETNSICSVDYTVISGFDAKKFSDLLTRALMRPSIKTGTEKIMLILIIVLVILALIFAFCSYMSYANSSTIVKSLPQIMAMAKGTVIGGTTAIWISYSLK